MKYECITAKKGDTILQVFPCGTIREIVVVSWGKKRATLINKSSIGTSTEGWDSYNVALMNGELISGPIGGGSPFYKIFK